MHLPKERYILRRQEMDFKEMNQFLTKLLNDFTYRVFETDEDFDQIFDDLNHTYTKYAKSKNSLLLSENNKKNPKWVTRMDEQWFYNWSMNKNMLGVEEYELKK